MAKRSGKQSAEVAARTRSEILTAATYHFGQQGFRGASLREIAADASTTHGLIRHHFGTKEDLWRAVVDDFVARFEAEHEPLLAQVGERDPVELLKAFVKNFVRVSATHPAATRIIMNDCDTPGLRLDYLIERLLPIHKAIQPVFHAARERGVAIGHDEDTFFVFLLMVGAVPFTVQGFVNRFYREPIESEAGIERHLELVIETLFGRL